MDALESRTRQIGRDIFARASAESSWRGPAAILRDKTLARVMGDESLKASLFRLVDVLPSLRTTRQINCHLQEYLTRFPLPIPQRGPLAACVAAVARATVARLARTFVAASDVPAAAKAAIAMRRKKLAFTIDLLGEAVVSETEADQYARQYMELIEGLTPPLTQHDEIGQIDCWPLGTLPRVNLSVKLSSLFSQFDPMDTQSAMRVVGDRLRPILQAARPAGAFVCFDMEQSSHKELTLRIFKEILLEPSLREWTDVGIAIQAYLPASGEDLIDLSEWAQKRAAPVWVRLVKGAYWDYECVIAAQNNWPLPVYSIKNETDANFERLTAFLVENNKNLRPAIASHNVRDIAHALALAEQSKLPPRTLEFQMLYGMAEPIRTALVESEQRVRIYTPVGQLLPGMAYLVRRLLENTSNQSFLRAALLEHASQEELLMNPLTRLAPKPVRPSRGHAFTNEPITDFSREPARDAMRTALAAQRSTPHPLVIGGERIVTGQWIESINPSHKRQIVGQSARATPEHARAAVAAAKTAFASWRDQPVSERANLLRRVAGELRRRRFDLAALEVRECGKPWREADADVAEAIDFCTYYAAQAMEIDKPRRADLPGETNVWHHEPRGVAAVIAPWNFPLAILCGMTAAAVVTGNTAVMKPAEQSSFVAAELMSAFERAGCPRGVANYLPGIGEEVGRELLSSSDVDIVAFTGSKNVGLSIMQNSAARAQEFGRVQRVIAEMGGKNAIIIDADADADDAIHGVTASAFGYSGQKCSACSRLIVLDEIYDSFMQRLVEAVKSLRIAPAEDPACFVGPVIDAEAHARIFAAIEQGKKLAKLAFAGDAGELVGEGFYIGPHLFTDVDPASPLAREEIFGPVLACMRARNVDHAIEIANSVDCALTGGFYSRSPANIEHVTRRFRVGDLYINRKITGALVGRQPFGGFKLSGIGCQAGGPEYLSQFAVQRVVTENTLRHGFAPGD